MTVQNEINKAKKHHLIFGIIFALVLLGQTIAYEDDIEQEIINCSVATYSLDNEYCADAQIADK